MFYAGWPGWVYCIAAYSLSCRRRFPDTGIIWNMLLIMFHFLWKNHFTCIALTYVTLCRNLLWQWCLKSTKARLLSTHLFPPARYMYVSLYLVKSFSVHVVYMSLIHYFIWNWHICYFMQAFSEAPVREEHQIGGLPLTSQQVCSCITFFVCLCIAFSDLVLVTHLFPPKVHVYLLTLAYIFFYVAW